MRRAGHAAQDGSFGRSAGMAAGRGAVLLAVAVILGVVLLNAADDPGPDRVATGASGSGEDGSAGTTTTTLPPTTLATVPPRPPAEVKVLSTNGTAVKGVAGRARDILQAQGYNVLAPTDAQRATASNVFFTSAEFEREAQAVASALGLPPTVVAPYPTAPPVPVADDEDDVGALGVGPELAQQLSTTTTTTTAAAPATTRATATSRP
ncbi:MAG TPA: LytR C-terminal domain-containing protein [Acidimicrobiales bacterium]|nr:LytR C-terminal domain-containing protein [Acidimicrobiales bacterium]